MCALLNQSCQVLYTHLLYSLSTPSLHDQRYPLPKNQTVLGWLRKRQRKGTDQVHTLYPIMLVHTSMLV